MILSPTIERYILHWGEMGARWGVNRTVAQIHALLYLSPKPLAADEIVDLLKVARSNVSNSIKELQSYGLIKTTHIMGDRRDHFEALGDTWLIFTRIIEERKKREIDPTLSMLRQCLLEADKDKKLDPVSKERIQNMHDFVETMTNWYSRVIQLNKKTLVKIMKLGEKVARFVK